MKTTTIVIESSGAVRINRGGVIHCHANLTYVAEALVQAMDEADAHREYADKIRRAAAKPPGNLTASEYQQQVLKAVNEEIPF